MATPLAQAPVLAHVRRGAFVESVHHGLVAVTGPDGRVEQAWGDAETVILPRSSLKPLQATAMVRAGLDLPPEQLALVCASHSGAPVHLDTVRAILTGAGLDVIDLDNTPSYPLDEGERDTWIAVGFGPTSLAQNCSGKHAGMLATCVANGWPTTGYRDPGHPLQQAIAATIADLTAGTVSDPEIDGCGAPVFGVPLAGLARAFARLATAPPESPEGRVTDAIRRHPELVGGTGRDVTALIAGTPGLIAKDGAEAVYAVGLPDGRGVAVKIADGAHRASTVVVAAVLRRLGVDSAAYETLLDAPVLGHGRPVGRVEAVL